MLKQLGIEIEFLQNKVSIGIGSDVIEITSKTACKNTWSCWKNTIPENKQDIAGIIQEIRKVMGYMDIQYGIDNPLFMDLTDLKYVTRTILPWA